MTVPPVPDAQTETDTVGDVVRSRYDWTRPQLADLLHAERGK